MYSSYHTAVEARGYIFKFPTLGLPDLDRTKAGWVPFKVAIGTKEACASLLEDGSTPAPLRSPDNGDYSVIEIEYEGMVWFLPFLDPLYNSEEPEVFSVNVRCVPASTMPSDSEGERPNVTIPIGMMFLSPPDNRLAFWPPMPTTQSASWDHSDLFELCLNPTEAQCEPATPAELATRAGDEDKHDETVKAWGRWAAMCLDEVSEEWLREVHLEAVAKGLRSNDSSFDPRQQLVRLRAHAAPNYNVEWLDYTICQKGDSSIPNGTEWKPLPQHAYSNDFVRCTVNLIRKECGRRLFRREAWPPGRASALQRGESMEEQGV